MNDNLTIDMHVHFGAPSTDPDKSLTECYWGPEFEKNISYPAMKLTTGLIFKKITFESIKNHIFKVIHTADKVDKVVLLALDHVYGADGEKDLDSSLFFTLNELILRLKDEYYAEYKEDKILYGCSVHPNDKNAESRLRKAKADGAVLCKWIPSSMLIDPTTPASLRFGELLAELDMPLLYHAGPEHAIPGKDSFYELFNNPYFTAGLLDKGVKVIIAHCAMPYAKIFDGAWESSFEAFKKLWEDTRTKDGTRRLYADVSALCTPTRNDYIKQVLDIGIPADRILFGSDYPIPIFDFSLKSGKGIKSGLSEFWEGINISNPLNKNKKLIAHMGFPEDIYTNFAKLINDHSPAKHHTGFFAKIKKLFTKEK